MIIIIITIIVIIIRILLSCLTREILAIKSSIIIIIFLYYYNYRSQLEWQDSVYKAGCIDSSISTNWLFCTSETCNHTYS